MPVIARLIASLAAVAAATAVCSQLSLNATTTGFAFLLVVLAIAAVWGLTESAVASVAAMLCFNFFFLPPVGRFTIADPQNWIALFTFLATALVASQLSDRAKKQALEAKRSQQETEQLYALSRSILLTQSSEPVGLQAANHIAHIFESNAVVLYDAKASVTYNGGPDDIPDIGPKLKQSVMEGTAIRDLQEDVLVSPITLGGSPIGSLAMRGVRLSDGALQALLNLVAIALERVRTEEAARSAEAAKRSEEFKSTLLDAIAHEFKTPLTSIKAASTSLVSGISTSSAEARELAAVIDEETDRLSSLVTEAVRMAQIDAGKLKLEREVVKVRDLIDRALEYFAPRVEGRPFAIEVASPIDSILVDRDLFSLALRQIIDNSLKYSPSGSPVEIRAVEEAGRAVIRIGDRGPGIPENERDRIFDRFYRRHSGRHGVPGSGLGLHIAREIARTHGGDVSVEPRDGGGSEFRIAIPLNRQASA